MTRHERISVQGHYAGPVSRALSAIVDIGVIVGTYTVSLAGLRLIQSTFFSGATWDVNGGIAAAVTLSLWSFTYLIVALAISGQTVGKALVGIRVVQADGATLTVRAAFVRTLMLPVSGLLFGIGFLMIIVQREHRALHDLAARTAVVYDWGGRTAQLPGPLSAYLIRTGAEPPDA